jgi:phosphatidylglycerophosphate synthase
VNQPPAYSYHSSLKSRRSDELINTYMMRPLAGVLVRLLYPTRVTPNHVTIASIAAGCIAAFCLSRGTPEFSAGGGVFIFLKDLLDTADGQLARAKSLYSRLGRFLDSMTDIVINLALFAALGATLSEQTRNPMIWPLALLGFLGLSLRVSYHVLYLTSYLHLQESYATNRTTEAITEEDRRAGGLTLFMQRLFLLLYGWQDALMVWLDRKCGRATFTTEDQVQRWYSDHIGLRLSGFLGIGTELFLLALFALFNRLELYLWWNVVIMNGIWAGAILYRKVVLSRLVRTAAG